MPMPMRRSYAPQIIGLMKSTGKKYTIEDISIALQIPFRSVSYVVTNPKWKDIEVLEDAVSKTKYYAYRDPDLEMADAVAEQATKDGDE